MQPEVKLKLPLLKPEAADESVKHILETTKNEMGFIPNMYATMANAPALIKAYLNGYAIFRRETQFSPVEQEVLFLTISRFNGCEYCVAAHSVIADTTSGVPADITDAIRTDKAIPNAKLAALHAFTKAMLLSRGLPAANDVEAFLQAGYTESHILDIIVAIAVKTLSNYSNHLLQPPVDDAFAGRTWCGKSAQ